MDIDKPNKFTGQIQPTNYSSPQLLRPIKITKDWSGQLLKLQSTQKEASSKVDEYLRKCMNESLNVRLTDTKAIQKQQQVEAYTQLLIACGGQISLPSSQSVPSHLQHGSKQQQQQQNSQSSSIIAQPDEARLCSDDLLIWRVCRLLDAHHNPQLNQRAVELIKLLFRMHIQEQSSFDDAIVNAQMAVAQGSQTWFNKGSHSGPVTLDLLTVTLAQLSPKVSTQHLLNLFKKEVKKGSRSIPCIELFIAIASASTQLDFFSGKKEHQKIMQYVCQHHSYNQSDIKRVVIAIISFYIKGNQSSSGANSSAVVQQFKQYIGLKDSEIDALLKKNDRPLSQNANVLQPLRYGVKQTIANKEEIIIVQPNMQKGNTNQSKIGTWSGNPNETNNSLKFHRKFFTLTMSKNGDQISDTFPVILPLLIEHFAAVFDRVTKITNSSSIYSQDNQQSDDIEVSKDDFRLLRYAANAIQDL
ncbi:MAG: hypothetical protein EZS28_025477 [Streblomastix strix]|uniref:Uncharacterized protein n=1 Tax=Streblomastix strix TaxID=222440 RepID=A0A5J4V923_9EUKA|nr:MAG: hypothetical protein EZS28_025477 [Streblomastix strix]